MVRFGTPPRKPFGKPKGYFDPENEKPNSPNPILIVQAQQNRLQIERDMAAALKITFGRNHPGDRLKQCFGIRIKRRRGDDED